ncbi:MAG: IPT/TIG domain-containing protein [Candidatus Cryptobacteroides sp.]
MNLNPFRGGGSTLETTAINPAEGEVGVEVTITGNNIGEGVEVYFRDVKATVLSATDNTIKTLAPENEAGECVVKVVLGEQKTENLKFTYLESTNVKITSLSAVSGYDQDEIKISGKNFNALAGLNAVAFGDTPAVVTAASPTELTVEVPYNDPGSYDVTVTVNGVTAYSPVQFKYNKDVYYCTGNVIDVSAKLAVGSQTNVYGILFLKDGRLAMGTRDGEVCLANIQTGEGEVIFSRTDGRRARGLAQNTRDSKMLFVAFQGHNSVKWINLETQGNGDLVTGLPGAMTVKFDKDDNMYVCTADEGNVYKFAKDAYSCDKSADENNAGKTLFTHFDDVTVKNMAFDNDGNLIVGMFHKVDENNKFPALYSVDKDGNQTLIAGSLEEGTTDRNTGEFRNPLTARFKGEILGLTVDSNNCIWFSDSSMGTYVIKPGKNGYKDATVAFVHDGGKGWVTGSWPEGYAQNPNAEGVEMYIGDYNHGGCIHKAVLTVE